MRSILLALDGSREGAGSIALTLRWAKRYNAAVTALGLVDEYAIATPESASIGGDAFKARRDENLLTLAHQHVDAMLTAFSGRAREAGISFSAVKHVADREADLVEMAQSHDVLILSRDTHFSGLDRFESDGTTESLIGQSPRPIVAVPAELTSGKGNLIACSGGVRSAHVVQALVATRIYESGHNWVISIDRHSEAAARAKGERVFEFLQAHGARCELLPIVSRKPIDELLLDHARRLQVELLVMGGHRQSWLESYFTSSTTHRVLTQATLPVFIAC